MTASSEALEAISWVDALVSCVDAETCSADADDSSATEARYSDVMIVPTVKPAKPPIRAKAHTSQIISYLNL